MPSEVNKWGRPHHSEHIHLTRQQPRLGTTGTGTDDSEGDGQRQGKDAAQPTRDAGTRGGDGPAPTFETASSPGSLT